MNSIIGSIIQLSHRNGVSEYDVQVDGKSIFSCQSNGEALRLYTNDNEFDLMVTAKDELSLRQRLQLRNDVVFRKPGSSLYVSMKTQLLSYSLILYDGDNVLCEDAIRMKGLMGKSYYTNDGFNLTMRWNKSAVFEMKSIHDGFDAALLCSVMCWFVVREDFAESSGGA